MPAGKTISLSERVVVGVGGRRRHAPAAAVHRLADLRAVVRHVEARGRPSTFCQYASRRIVHAAVVLPLVRIADLGVEGGELLERLLPSSRRPSSPGRGWCRPWPAAGSSPSPACAPWPRAGSASRRTCWPSASPSSVVGRLHAALPARLHLLRPAQVARCRTRSPPPRTASESDGAATLSRCHFRYVFQVASGVCGQLRGRTPA